MKTQDKIIAHLSRRLIYRATAGDGPKQSVAALDNRGFTLIEMLIVVAIIGILATMAIPAFNDISLKAKNASAKSDLRLLDQAINAYIIDQDKLPNQLADIGMQATIKDPWKRPYQYFNIGTGTGDGARYTTWAAPPLDVLNDDYDLYSRGPDGVTVNKIDTIKNDSSDDIVRANNGTTVELATEY